MDVKDLLTVLAATMSLAFGSSPPTGYIEHVPGAIKEFKGTIFPISSFVDVQLNLQPLKDFQSELSEMARNIDLMITNIFKYTGPDDHFQILSPALHRLKFKLASYTDKSYNPSNANRTRRGLFDFVGVLSNKLFGIIDTQSLETRLEDYGGRQNSIAKTITANTRAIATLDHNVKQLRDATVEFHNMINERLNSADMFAELAFIINQYELTFTHVSTAAERFQTAVLHAAEGHVSKDLISPHDIRRTIHDLKASHNLQPLFRKNQYMLLYSCLTSYLTETGISILLPLQPPATLKGYILHPFPLPVSAPSSYVSLQAPNIILAPQRKQVVSQTHAIALPPQNLYETCLSPATGIYVCMAPLWPYYTNVSSCAHAVIAHPHNIRSACSFSPLSPSHHPFTVATQLQTVFYFFDNTPTTVTCNNNVTQSHLKGPFVLPHSCALSSMSFSFPAIRHFHAKLNASMQFPVPTILPIPHTHFRHQMNLTLSPIRIPQPLAPPIHHHRMFAYGYPIAMSVGVVTLIFSIIFLVAACMRRVNRANLQYC